MQLYKVGAVGITVAVAVETAVEISFGVGEGAAVGIFVIRLAEGS